MKKQKKIRSAGVFAGEQVLWFAEEVEPGTPYVDEPDEMVPPGWYVVGRPVEDNLEQAVIIVVDDAYGPEGEDLRGEMARAIAAGLNGTVIGSEAA